MSLAKPIAIALRGLEFLWALLVMAIVGNMIAEAHDGSASIVNYSMFLAVLAMLSLFYLIPATIKDSLSISPWFVLIVDLINVLFWFCGAVALAAELGTHSCSNVKWRNNNGITDDVKNGHGRAGRCAEAQAVCAFLFFGFFAFLASAILSGLNARSGVSFRGSGIRRGPAMSQV